MLLRFSVSNFRSVCELQELTLVATKLKEEEGLYVLTPPRGAFQVLPLATIFGANASGKSNFLRAIGFMARMVVISDDPELGRRGFERHFFKLDPAMSDQPSRFFCEFLIDETRYQYSFEISNTEVIRETLYAYPRGQRQVWFDRDTLQKDPFYFGKFLKGRNRSLAEKTKSGSLFLSTAGKWNHSQLLPVYRFFEEKVRFFRGIPSGHLVGMPRSTKRQQQIVEYLRKADVGIHGVAIKDEPLEERTIRARNAFLEVLMEDSEDLDDFLDSLGDTQLSLEIEHLNSAGEVIKFGLEEESQGTKRLFALLDPVLTALEEGNVLIIDEVDTSLHPFLLRKILLMFHDRSINTGSGQLIFTSHDATVLDAKLMRRDEKWFTEKDKFGKTTLHPLTKFSTRQQDDIVRYYLEGRYGGVPILPERLLETGA